VLRRNKLLKRKLSLDEQKMQFSTNSVAECDLHLWKAASQYMKGEIDINALEYIERRHDPDLKNAVLVLAKEKLEQHFVLALQKLLHFFRKDKASLNFQK